MFYSTGRWQRTTRKGAWGKKEKGEKHSCSRALKSICFILIISLCIGWWFWPNSWITIHRSAFIRMALAANAHPLNNSTNDSFVHASTQSTQGTASSRAYEWITIQSSQAYGQNKTETKADKTKPRGRSTLRSPPPIYNAPH